MPPTIVSKANRLIGLIFKSFTYIDTTMFLNLYKSLIRPNIEYASCIWNPMLLKDKIVIDNVKRRATKRLNGLTNLSYEQRLRSLGLPSLEYRRKRSDLIQIFKIINNIDEVDKDKLFTMSPITSTSDHSKKILKPVSRLEVTKHRFNSRIVDIWNNLPENVVSAKSVNSLNRALTSTGTMNPPNSLLLVIVLPDRLFDHIQ
ncbi:uncharacterized protein [Argopecten irradians]|uniref:uncharacterized protein n=1 Tax=Argopecten irradians TaxID=31199 RepID=UPI0037221E22